MLEQRFAKWACDRFTEDVDFGKKIIFSDEAPFNLAIENPHAYIFLRNFLWEFYLLSEQMLP